MKIPGLRYGVVINNDDPAGAGRISVMLIPEDYKKKNLTEEKVSAFPALPKMLHIIPKVGEGVFVFLANSTDGDSQRYYIGPVISQLHRMYYEPWRFGGDSYQKGASKDMDVNPYMSPESIGAYPHSDDISIIGRKNCEVHIKDDDIRIQAGVRLSNDKSTYKVVYNRTDPAFIKLKYHETPLDGEVKSTATIVADRINILSNKSATPQIDRNEDESVDELITDKALNEILEEGYKLPYGEKLVELLRKMIKVFCQHTHDFSMKIPNQFFVDELESASAKLLSNENPELLSDSIRIN